MRLRLAAVLGTALLVGCGGAPAEQDTERPGNPEVYQRIESLTDCEALQQEFDTAMDNAEARESGDPLRDASLSYADAADARMEEIGCYG